MSGTATTISTEALIIDAMMALPSSFDGSVVCSNFASYGGMLGVLILGSRETDERLFLQRFLRHDIFPLVAIALDPILHFFGRECIGDDGLV